MPLALERYVVVYMSFGIYCKGVPDIEIILVEIAFSRSFDMGCCVHYLCVQIVKDSCIQLPHIIVDYEAGLPSILVCKVYLICGTFEYLGVHS